METEKSGKPQLPAHHQAVRPCRRHGISLTLYRGEILSLLGENGSGKTTLMNMLSGIYHPDQGQTLVDGREVTIRDPKDAFACGIGMIHQHLKLVDVFTAAENMSWACPAAPAWTGVPSTRGSGKSASTTAFPSTPIRRFMR